jgi:hypothetical protein
VKENIVYSVAKLPARFGGEPHTGWLPPGAAVPPDTPVVDLALDLSIIEEGPGSYLLEWHPSTPGLGSGQPYESDSWHPSIEEALKQAELWFGIPADGWVKP